MHTSLQLDCLAAELVAVPPEGRPVTGNILRSVAFTPGEFPEVTGIGHVRHRFSVAISEVPDDQTDDSRPAMFAAESAAAGFVFVTDDRIVMALMFGVLDDGRVLGQDRWLVVELPFSGDTRIALRRRWGLLEPVLMMAATGHRFEASLLAPVDATGKSGRYSSRGTAQVLREIRQMSLSHS